jgi:predicted nucleic acid-binding protein
MSVGVIDAGVAIAWIRGTTRSQQALDRLYTACRNGRLSLVMSTVNLAEVLIHTAKYARAAGVDPVTFLTASGLRIHPPDEAIARRVAQLDTSLADGFAAATAQELGARFHTTDRELVRQLRRVRLAITHY